GRAGRSAGGEYRQLPLPGISPGRWVDRRLLRASHRRTAARSARGVLAQAGGWHDQQWGGIRQHGPWRAGAAPNAGRATVPGRHRAAPGDAARLGAGAVLRCAARRYDAGRLLWAAARLRRQLPRGRGGDRGGAVIVTALLRNPVFPSLDKVSPGSDQLYSWGGAEGAPRGYPGPSAPPQCWGFGADSPPQTPTQSVK